MDTCKPLPPEEIKRRVIGIVFVMLGFLALSGVALYLRQFIHIAG